MLIKHLFENSEAIDHNIIEMIAKSEYFKNEYADKLYSYNKYDLEYERLLFDFTNLYRGSDDYENPVNIIKPYTTGRNPSNTNIIIHDFVNMISKERLGLPIRNLIFSNKDYDISDDYGAVYVLFPLDGYKLYYHKGVVDFTAHYNADTIAVYSLTLDFFYDNSNTYDLAIADKVLDHIYQLEEYYNKLLTVNTKSEFYSAIKEICATVTNKYMETVSEDNTVDNKELFNDMYKFFEEYFNNFEKYVNNMTVTKTLDGLNNEEVMISAPQIIAVHEKHFNHVMQKLWSLKKEP